MKTSQHHSWDSKKKQSFYGPYRKASSSFWDWMMFVGAVIIVIIAAQFLN